MLGDPAGAPHKGIDYVLRDGKNFVAFDVFAMHGGLAFHGTSESWGRFVIVHATAHEGIRHLSVYAHLDEVTDVIPQDYLLQNGEKIKNVQGFPISAGERIGRAGTTGVTNGINQLHLEFHEVNITTKEWKKLDPYGVNDRASSGRYPKPGASLAGLGHAWMSDAPPLASPR